jgi:hypothetical protein
MADYIRMVFDRLHAAGEPDAAAREHIYADCRTEVTAANADEKTRLKELDDPSFDSRS